MRLKAPLPLFTVTVTVQTLRKPIIKQKPKRVGGWVSVSKGALCSPVPEEPLKGSGPRDQTALVPALSKFLTNLSSALQKVLPIRVRIAKRFLSLLQFVSTFCKACFVSTFSPHLFQRYLPCERLYSHKALYTAQRRQWPLALRVARARKFSRKFLSLATPRPYHRSKVFSHWPSCRLP